MLIYTAKSYRQLKVVAAAILELVVAPVCESSIYILSKEEQTLEQATRSLTVLLLHNATRTKDFSLLQYCSYVLFHSKKPILDSLADVKQSNMNIFLTTTTIRRPCWRILEYLCSKRD